MTLIVLWRYIPHVLECYRQRRTTRITGRARARKLYRPTQLCALRLIRLFDRAQNPSTDEETREERESGREATPRERTVGGEHVEE